MEKNQPAISPLEIRTGEGDLVEFFHGFPDTLRKSYKLTGFNSMHATGDFGHMGFQHFAGNGFAIWYSEYSISRPVDFLTRGDVAMLELSIPLAANTFSSWDNLDPVFIQDEQFELSYTPFTYSATTFRKDCRTFDIHYSREYLDRFAGTNISLGHFLEAVDRGEPVTLTGSSKFFSPGMKRLIQDILCFDMADQLSPFFYEASVLMMLTMVLDRIQPVSRPFRYSIHEKESATEARNLLVADFSEKYSIRDLARKTGTSETRLQLTFKHLYGNTLFEYAQTARLDFAKLLLLDTHATVQSVAERCGYPDNSNLTAAFKKRFGCSPDAFRSLAK
jgi:AraC-like DNA-binding protein